MNRIEHAQAQDRYVQRLWNIFINEMTPKQRESFLLDDKVPKALKHQRNYQNYKLADDELKVLERRLQFKIVG